MKLTVSKRVENPLLRRTYLSGTVDFEGATPSAAEVAEAISREAKGIVVVKNIYTKYAQHQADIQAVVYKSHEDKQNVEKMTKHLRKKAEEAAKKEAEKKTAEQAESKPAPGAEA